MLQELRWRTATETCLPILILTADIAAESRHRALAAGANDFLTKPFDPAEVLLACELQLSEIDVRLDLAPDVPLVWGDEDQLSSVRPGKGPASTWSCRPACPRAGA